MNNEKYSNIEIWKMAEEETLLKGTVIEDEHENQFIFTGKSFQLSFSLIDKKEKYIGFCVGDKWKIVGVFEEDLEIK